MPVPAPAGPKHRSVTQMPRPDMQHHARTGSSGSQILEVPTALPTILRYCYEPHLIQNSSPPPSLLVASG